MIAEHFRRRYLDGLPIVRTGLDVGMDEFVKPPMDAVGGLPLSELEQGILRTVGLPREAGDLIFGPESGSEFFRGLDRVEPSVEGGDRFVVIGRDSFGDRICLERTSGQVVTVDETDGRMHYLNRNLGLLLEFICLWQDCVNLERIRKVSLRKTLMELDPDALEENRYWRQSLDHLEA